MAEQANMMDAKGFWDLYFRNRFVEMTRDADWINGVARMEPAAGKSSFAEAPMVSVRIKRDDLKRYACETDGRFAEIRKAPTSLVESVRRLADESYPFREHPPFGAKRMGELLKQAMEQFDWPRDASFSPDMLIHSIQCLASNYKPENGQLLNALLWVAGEQKQRVFSKVIMSAIAESQPLPSGHNRKMSAAVENTAFEALWKINDKSCCDSLLQVMELSDHSGRLRCAAVFKRLFSNSRLLSLEALGENYFSPGYWKELIKAGAANSAVQWDRFDTKSLFWEIRYLAAVRLEPKDAAFRTIMDDEVSLVRELAVRKSA